MPSCVSAVVSALCSHLKVLSFGNRALQYGLQHETPSLVLARPNAFYNLNRRNDRRLGCWSAADWMSHLIKGHWDELQRPHAGDKAESHRQAQRNHAVELLPRAQVLRLRNLERHAQLRCERWRPVQSQRRLFIRRHCLVAKQTNRKRATTESTRRAWNCGKSLNEVDSESAYDNEAERWCQERWPGLGRWAAETLAANTAWPVVIRSVVSYSWKKRLLQNWTNKAQRDNASTQAYRTLVEKYAKIHFFGMIYLVYTSCWLISTALSLRMSYCLRVRPRLVWLFLSYCL